MNLPVGGTYIYQRDDATIKEEEVYLLETIKKYLDASHFLTIHTAKTAEFDSGIGIYRSDEHHPYTAQDKQFLDYLNPILVSFVHTMTLHSEFDLKRVSIDKLAGSQKALTMSFSDQLEPLDIPKETERFINRYFPSAGQHSIPDPIDNWIRQQIAPKGCLEPNSGPWFNNIYLPELDLHCKAYTVITETQAAGALCDADSPQPAHGLFDSSIRRTDQKRSRSGILLAPGLLQQTNRDGPGHCRSHQKNT